MSESFEDIRINCSDRSGEMCLKNPDSLHDCEKGLCDRLNLSIRKRAEILARSDDDE